MAAKSYAEMVAAAKARIENLDVAHVAAERDAGAVIVDIREEAERSQHGAIPGAVFAPRGLLEFCADPSSPAHMAALDPKARVILHCAGGGRSALAAVTLQEMGFENVAHLEGGFTAWKAAGQPVEQPR